MNWRNHLKQLVREVVTEVETVHEDIAKKKEAAPAEQADIIDTDNQLDTAVWEPEDSHPNIVHGAW